MNNAWLYNLVPRASLLSDRLASKFVPDGAQSSDVITDARLARWRYTAFRGDPERFARRLANDGLDTTTVRPWLGAVRLSNGWALPAWARTLQKVIEAAGGKAQFRRSACGETGFLCLDPGNLIPFEDALLPFVHVARQRLNERPGVNYHLLPKPCRATLDHHLLHILSYVGAQTLLLTFSVFRVQRERRVGKSASQRSSSREHYVAFVDYLLNGGWRVLFEEYPVLARLLATRTDFWVESTGEFLQRLQEDYPQIISDFGLQSEGAASRRISESVDQPATAQGAQFAIQNLQSIEPGLSDPHNDGRSVTAVTFASGQKLIYKPKSLGMEQAYNGLIRWLNERGLSPTFKPLRVIDRTTHGWVESVEHHPCQNQNEVRQYYQRAGMLLALLYALGGKDYHDENLIACGPHPMPVDHEMLMAPELPVEDAGNGMVASDELRSWAQQQLLRSVLNTGVLPMWEVMIKGQVHDVSAFGTANVPSRVYHRLRWKHINTDQMKRVWEPVTVESVQKSNVPTLHEEALPLNDYGDEFLDGFRRAYRFLLNHRDALLAPDGPLASFKGRRIRFVLRKTRLYWKLLMSSLASKHMRDGVDRSIHLDILSRTFLLPENQHLPWPLLRAEQSSLAHMDVPLFTLRTDSRDLDLGNGEIVENFFSESGYQVALGQIAGLSEEDLERQVGFIRASLVDWVGGEEGTSLRLQGQKEGEDITDLDAVVSLTQEQMVRQAVAIAGMLQKHAISSNGKAEATWLHLAYDARLGRYQLEPLGYDLYNGVCGVALFLAALSRVAAEAEYRCLALAAMRPLRNQVFAASLIEKPGFSRSVTNIGGASGIGSIVYALVRSGQFLEDAVLLEDAHHAASLLTPERIAEDRSLDVISGAAGAILGLLALHEASPNPESLILQRAVVCGKHLLDVRVADESGLRAWPTLNGKLLTGFSHGAAGIAYALLRLYQATGETEFRKAAQEAIAYEHSVFVPEAGNWPDFRSNASVQEPSFVTSWCHGAPGIGLARLGGLDVLDTDQVRADIGVALKTTQEYGAQGLDHLCCGSLGRAEFLLAAALHLEDPALRKIARNWASWIVHRAERNGGYVLRLSPSGRFQEIAPIYSPGFFQGLAGIGYELLRMAHPEQLPSVLLWE